MNQPFYQDCPCGGELTYIPELEDVSLVTDAQDLLCSEKDCPYESSASVCEDTCYASSYLNGEEV